MMTQGDLCAALLAADAGCRIFCCTYFALLFAVQPDGGLLCAVSGILIEMGVIGCVRPETRMPRTPRTPLPTPDVCVRTCAEGTSDGALCIYPALAQVQVTKSAGRANGYQKQDKRVQVPDLNGGGLECK